MHYALHIPPIDDLVRIELEDIGKEIVKKLKGLPLGAKIVGGQLCLKKDVKFWREVRDRDLWNEMNEALWWSYQLFDEEVRRCFAYCSVFPTGRWLKQDELVKLWAAQGFARRGNEGERKEDVYRNYFDELLSASFLQLSAEHPNQEDYYVVHDLLHDLAEKAAGSECFRFRNMQSPEVEVPPDIRHVFLQTYDAALITEKICKLDSLRTLIIDKVEYLEREVLKTMFERLRKLRVLIMTGRGSNKMFMSESESEAEFPPFRQFSVPASIGQLRHLRYLAFRSYGGTELIRLVLPDTLTKGTELIRLVLPDILTKLYHMEVLDLSCIDELVFSSWEGIFGLINVPHLIGPIKLKIPNIGRLTLLQSMRYFAARKEQGYELKQLGNLNKLSGKLWINCLENVESQQEALEAKLADKEGVTELTLSWSWRAFFEESPEVQTEVLEGLCPPMGLKSLTIDDYKGLRYPSWMVLKDKGGPKYLTYLRLDGWIAEPGPELRGFFTHLRWLTIKDCSWHALPDFMEHLASLQTLVIYRCMNIQSLPTLPWSLQDFALLGCSDVLISSCKTIGDPCWQKIQHISSAYIGDCEFEMGAVLQERGSESSLSEETSAVKRKFQWRLKKKSVRLTRLSRVH